MSKVKQEKLKTTLSELILSYDMSTSEGCTSAIFRGRYVPYCAYISEECLKNTCLSIHCKNLEKEENSLKNSKKKGRLGGSVG